MKKLRAGLPLTKVLILGSGGLRIGQAGEFDYSGSQAIKALQEEGIATVLVNPNIATVQTDGDMADKVYLQPLNVPSVTKIIRRERPNGILLGFGGQTALNIGLALQERGILRQYRVKVLGTSVKTIRTTEDRDLFKAALGKIGVKTARSRSAKTVTQALAAAESLGYPVMLRSGFSLGGRHAGKVRNHQELTERAPEALSSAARVLIEEYLEGWKEIEYEIVRDAADNAVAVCNMENFDPMGIHTGESIVVAPSQTLNNQEYHRLRELALRVARHLGIIGECNIQFALDPSTGDYRVIEVNARLSRSSALASKATGYPLAFVATKLVLGQLLPQVPNAVTGKTTAFFEPALDYLVVKIPRWDTTKFRHAKRLIGSEMKSVGEVMAIGRSFPEALQKAVRMLNQGSAGLASYSETITNPGHELRQATDRRLFALYEFFRRGGNVERANRLTSIDRWFLHQLYDTAELEGTLRQRRLTTALLRQAKMAGFSDRDIASLKGTKEQTVRHRRQQSGIVPHMKQIDTLAGEFAATTNYLYTTYHADRDDVGRTTSPAIIVLGSGPYSIGSSVEFDWCAVNTARALRRLGHQTIIINSNPETVSTDFDESDRLYFEELTLERIRDIADFEQGQGLIVSMGGQIANNVARPLAQRGYRLFGTDAKSIDQAENRRKFSALLNRIRIDQPDWQEVSTLSKARSFAARVDYPVLVRPSYVLSGAAMSIASNDRELARYLERAGKPSPDRPVVISKFIENAKELEVDGVADHGRIVIEAITEHVENAGVHSGDATVVLPPQRLFLETIRRTKRLTRRIVKALQITGPFNIQFLAKDNHIKVIECNVRASRSFPFVSKVTNHNFARIATEVMLGRHTMFPYQTLELDYVGVKSPQFSYSRLKGADPVAHVEMAATGEVACLGDNLHEAFFASWLASEQHVRGKRLLVSIHADVRIKLLDELRALAKRGWRLFATTGTKAFLAEYNIPSTLLHKISEKAEPNISTAIAKRGVDLIINIPQRRTGSQRTDGYRIRRMAIDYQLPIVTNLQLAELLLRSLTETNISNGPVKSWQEFVQSKSGA